MPSFMKTGTDVQVQGKTVDLFRRGPGERGSPEFFADYLNYAAHSASHFHFCPVSVFDVEQSYYIFKSVLL